MKAEDGADEGRASEYAVSNAWTFTAIDADSKECLLRP